MTRFKHWRLLAALAALGVVLTACSDTGTAEDQEEETAADATEETTTEEAEEPATVLTVMGDTVSGPLNIPESEMGGAVCVQQSRFARNSEIVWRARVLDGTGAQLGDGDLESVEVRLADGQVFDMRYGPHPRDNATDEFWTVAFDIPADYPTGTLNYEIVATAPDGTTATFAPFNVAPSLLTITDEVLETIEESDS